MHKPSPLLLDTHIWVCLVDGASVKISAPVLARNAEAAAKGRVYVSAISVWELGMLEAKKRLSLSTEISVWVERALAIPGVNLATLTTEISLASSRLPGAIHWSLADRIIIPTARSFDVMLVTSDPAILEYARDGHVKTLTANF